MHVCDIPGCGREFPKLQGLSMHKSRSHGGAYAALSAPAAPLVEVAPKRPTRAKTMTADDLFERVADATVALFPAGIPASRVIEIAGLQREMLKVVSR